METAQNLLMYGLFAFFGFIGFMVIIAMLFGHRVIKKWDFEAEFRNDKGREIAEFEIELSKVDKKETDFTLKVEFWVRHEAVRQDSLIQVYLDDELVMEGRAKEAGLARFGKEELRSNLSDPQPGQSCAIFCDGAEILREVLQKDN